MIHQYVITPHGAESLARRGIAVATVDEILAAPEQWSDLGGNRVVLQSRVFMGVPQNMYLIRVFVDLEPRPPEVVTAYRTSKIWKYWK